MFSVFFRIAKKKKGKLGNGGFFFVIFLKGVCVCVGMSGSLFNSRFFFH